MSGFYLRHDGLVELARRSEAAATRSGSCMAAAAAAMAMGVAHMDGDPVTALVHFEQSLAIGEQADCQLTMQSSDDMAERLRRSLGLLAPEERLRVLAARVSTWEERPPLQWGTVEQLVVELSRAGAHHAVAVLAGARSTARVRMPTAHDIKLLYEEAVSAAEEALGPGAFAEAAATGEGVEGAALVACVAASSHPCSTERPSTIGRWRPTSVIPSTIFRSGPMPRPAATTPTATSARSDATGTRRIHRCSSCSASTSGPTGLAWAAPRLEQLGALMGGPIAERAEETDRNPPRLEKYDRWGRDVSEVVMPATFEASRRDLIEHNFSSPEFRDEARQAGVDPAPLSAAWAYLLDQAEIGMMCALGTGGDMVVRLADEFAPDDVKQRVRELFAAGEYAGEAAQMLTERTGGSDLAELETTATPDGDAWRISGFKWFASNANGSAFVVLAKPVGAPDGIRGIAPFLVLRERRDGSRNGVRIRRLKDKLGTKAVASAEVEFDGAEAHLLAPSGSGSATAAGDGRGMARMMELTNGARLGIAMMGLGCARRALVESLCYARAREAFGSELVHHPLMQRKLAELIVEVEAAQALVFDGYLGPAAAPRRAADQAARGPPRDHRRQRRHRDPRRQRLHRAMAGRPAATGRAGEHRVGGPRQHPVPRRAPGDRA